MVANKRYYHSNFYSRLFWFSGGILYKEKVRVLYPEQYKQYYPDLNTITFNLENPLTIVQAVESATLVVTGTYPDNSTLVLTPQNSTWTYSEGLEYAEGKLSSAIPGPHTLTVAKDGITAILNVTVTEE